MEWIAAAVSLWAPMIVISLFAAVYLWQVYQFLTAPGKPVVYEYQASGGKYKLTAKNYTFDPISLSGVVSGVQLSDPAGTAIAELDSLILRFEKNVLSIGARRGDVHIDREKSGFPIEKALPKQTGEKSDLAYRFEGHDLTVHYADRSAEPGLPAKLSAREVFVDGSADAAVFRMVGSLNGSPVESFGAWSSVDGWRADLAWPAMQSSWVLPHVERWVQKEVRDELSRVTALNAQTSGAMRMSQANGKPIHFDGNVKLRASGVAWSDVIRGGSLDAALELRNDTLGVLAKLNESNRNAKFDGVLGWADGFRAQGKISASAATERALWVPLRKLVPTEIRANRVTLNGILKYSGGQYDISGQMQAGELNLAGEKLRSVAAKTRFTHRGLAIDLERGQYGGTAIRGAMSLGYDSNRIDGFVSSKSVNLSTWGSRFGLQGLSGNAAATAVISGKSSKPKVDVDLAGSARLAIKDLGRWRAGAFDARVNWFGDKVNVNRFLWRGPDGVVSARGQVEPNRKRLALDVRADGVRVDGLTEDLRGLMALDGRVTGTFSNPEFAGVAALDDLKLGERRLPTLSAKVALNKTRIAASRVVADDGLFSAQGALTYNMKSKRIDGTMDAKSIQLADWADQFGGSGWVDASEIKIGGTIDEPSVAAIVSARTARIGGQTFGDVLARVRLQKGVISVHEASAKLADGQISGSGEYNLKAESGSADVNFDGVLAAKLLPPSSDVDFDSRLFGTANAIFNKEKIAKGAATINVKDANLEGVPVGSGKIEVAALDNVFTANLGIGQDDRFLLGENLLYDHNQKSIGGVLDALNMPLASILRSDQFAKRIALNDTMNSIRERLSASLTARIQLSGTTDDPYASMPNFALDAIQIDDQPAGKIEAVGTYSKGDIRIKSALWKHENSTVGVSGSIKSDGELALTGSINQFDLAWMNRWNPEWPAAEGQATIFMDISGTTREPIMLGSADFTYAGLSASALNPDKIPPSLSLYPLKLEKNRIELEGKYSVDAFSGSLKGAIPLAALDAQNLSAEPFQIDISADERKLKDFAEVISGLDAKRTTGTASGSAKISGTAADYDIRGELKVVNGQLALDGYESMLTELGIALTSSKNELRLAGQAKSSKGGSVTLAASAKLPTQVGGDMTAARFLREASLDGLVKFDDLVVIENPSQADKRFNARIAPSEIRVSGSLAEPVLSGNVLLADIDTAIPTAPEEGEPSTFAINPLFKDFGFTLLNTATIRSTSAKMVLTGGGKVTGNLQAPKAQADFDVRDGIFSLPNARIDLETGKIRFRYDGALVNNAARLDLVNLEGRTTVSARRLTDTVERYDVTLFLNGNLLEDGGLTINATSDPPDLTSQEILAILGQKDLIEDIARAATGQQRSSLGDTALQYALPALSNVLTANMASSFKLDYVGVEYNPFDQYIFTAGKTLAKGLTVDLRRQLTAQPNQKLKYDFRLVYRIPSRDKFLSRLRLSFGIDQDRPWRIGFDYVTRF